MPRIHTLNDVGNGDGSKLGSPPSNRYPPSRLELEEQLKKDHKKFIRSAKRLLTKYHVLDEKNKYMQNDLDHSHEENEHMYNSMNQITP
jgi:flagellar motor component MotA